MPRAGRKVGWSRSVGASRSTGAPHMSILYPHAQTLPIRLLCGQHLGSAKRPYQDRLQDGADLVEGLAERRSPTVKQAAADVGVCPVALGQFLRKHRGWRGNHRGLPAKRLKSNARRPVDDLHALWRMAHALGTDAVLELLAEMGAPAVPVNGNGTVAAKTNGAGTNGAGTAAAVTSTTNGTGQHVDHA